MTLDDTPTALQEVLTVQRRLKLVVLVTSLAVLVAAVGASTSAGSGRKGLRTIEFVNPLPAYPSFAYANQCFKSAAKSIGAQPISVGPTGLAINNQFLTNAIEQAIARKVDALVIVPLDTHLYSPLIAKARNAGILVATMNTGRTTTNQNVELGTSYPGMGKAVAKGVQGLGGQINMGVLSIGSQPPWSLFLAGYTNAIKSLPNQKLVDVEYAQGDVNKDVDTVSAMLTAHPEINAIWTIGGTGAAPAATAVNEHGQKGKVAIVTEDLGPQTRSEIMNGDVYGTVIQNFCGMATGAVHMLNNIKLGKKIKSHYIDTGARFVTKANLPAHNQ